MKSFRQMKKWTLMSVLLCGISLAAYAIAPQVRIIWWTLTDITSSSAHLVVEHEGATSFELKISPLNGSYVTEYSQEIENAIPGNVAYSVIDLTRLHPNTEYIIEIKVIGCPDENGRKNNEKDYIFFTTTSEP